jgi:hypothetical protein
MAAPAGTMSDPPIRATLERMRRELVVVAGLLVLLTVSAAVAWSHVVSIPALFECGLDRMAGTPAAEACRSASRVLSDLQGLEAQNVVGLAAFTPFIVGLLLGVPLLGRGDDPVPTARSLVRRIVPVLAIVILGLAIVAVAVDQLTGAPFPRRALHDDTNLAHLTVEPLSFVGRGVMAFGIGLLAGALLRQAFLAYAVSVLVLLGVLALAPFTIHGAVAGQVAAWHEPRCAACEPPDGIWLGSALRDDDGRIMDYVEARDLQRERCPSCSVRNTRWIDENLTSIERVAPGESYRTFDAAEGGAWSAIGLACILLTFPVVRRRRPA